MRNLLKEPLLHFLALGALIFIFYNWLDSDAPSQAEIVVTKGHQEHLINVFSRTWQRPPTNEEFQGLVQNYIRDEIAYREGQKMGLARNDSIIRRRVRQKLELLTDEVVGLAEPTEEELELFLTENAESFRIEPRLDLSHIYLSRDRRGEAAERDASVFLEQLHSDPTTQWTDLGDPMPIGDFFDDIRLDEVERQFGSAFAQQVLEVPRGTWAGPVSSSFGLHIVHVDQFVPARDPELEEVRERVRTDWFALQRQVATEKLYDRLAENYQIKVESMSEPGGK